MREIGCAILPGINAGSVRPRKVAPSASAIGVSRSPGMQGADGSSRASVPGDALWLEKSIGRIFRRDEKKPTSWGGSVEFPSFAGPRGYLTCALAARRCRIRRR